MSSACWDTSRARLESLQAAARARQRGEEEEEEERMNATETATLDCYSALIAKTRCYMLLFDVNKSSPHSF